MKPIVLGHGADFLISLTARAGVMAFRNRSAYNCSVSTFGRFPSLAPP
jgi:hypothetical protein